MCLIIMREKGIRLPEKDFLTAVDNNGDGWGLSVPDGEGYLHTTRCVPEEGTDPMALYDLLHTEYKDDKFMLHLRYATAGDTTLRNAHPFPILERDKHGVDIRMAHNGTLSVYSPKATADNSWESDTRVFTRLFVRPLMERMVKAFGDEVLDDTFVHDLLHNQLTTSSVLTFIDGSGNVMYVNELGNGGFFADDGTYYSNKYSFTENHRSPSRSLSGGTNTNGGTVPRDSGQHYGGGYYEEGYLQLDGTWSTYDDEDSGWYAAEDAFEKDGRKKVRDEAEEAFNKTKRAEADKAEVILLGKSQPRPEEKGKGMADTRTDKFSDVFSEKYGVDGIEDMFNISDSTIEAMLKLDTDAADLFIKEMLSHAFNLYQTKGSLERQVAILSGQKTKAEGMVHDAHQRIVSQSTWIKKAKDQGYNGKAA